MVAHQFKATQLCDSGNVLSSTIDACRPILGNSAAPLSAVGQITAISGGVPTVMNVGTGATTTLSDVHWIINDLNAAKFFGTPFAGTRRNPGTRGDTINQGNLTMSKNFKATERVGIQFRTTAYNWLNRQFRGTPDAFVDDVSTDASTNSFANTNLNDTGGGSGDLIASGIGRRRLEFGLRLTF